MWYPIKLKRDTNDTILVSFPDFPKAHTWGEEKEDAFQRAVDALETVIQGYMTDKRAIPAPRRRRGNGVELPTQAVVKILLYQVMREREMSKSELARRLHWHRPQVDRLLDLRHASRLDHVDAAMQELNARFTIEAAQGT
jgi:antitoxin HicB